MKSLVTTIKVFYIKYVVDSWAWIEYLIASPAGEKIKDIVEDSNNIVYINSIILAEVISKTVREKRNIKTAFDALTTLSVIADINYPVFSREVGALHAEIKNKIKDFGLADAFVLVTAQKLGAKILTGDPHFRSFKEAVMI